VGNHRVVILSQVDNFFDGIYTWLGENVLFEIKSKKGNLSDGQKILHQTWGGRHYVFRNKEDVDKALGIS